MYVYIYIYLYVYTYMFGIKNTYMQLLSWIDLDWMHNKKNEASDPYKVGLHYFEMVDLTHVSMSPLTYRSKPGML